MPSDLTLEQLTVTARPLRLDLKTPFRIAHGSSDYRLNVLIRIGDGIGEAALPPYYGLTASQVVESVDGMTIPCPVLSGVPVLKDALGDLPALPAQTRAALDMALHDHWARALDAPLYRLLGLNPSGAPPTARTIGICKDEAELDREIESTRGFSLLKLKLGSGNLDADLHTVRSVLARSQSRICIDVNGGWTPAEAAVAIESLPADRTAFIEEPVGRGNNHDSWRELVSRLGPRHPPLVADESIQTTEDILALHGIADGINVKLAKAGGIGPALEHLTLARILGMRTLLGCMIESSVAVTAAAHIAPLADFLDLDATLNLSPDPFDGVRIDGEHIRLPDRPGIGVTRRSSP